MTYIEIMEISQLANTMVANTVNEPAYRAAISALKSEPNLIPSYESFEAGFRANLSLAYKDAECDQSQARIAFESFKVTHSNLTFEEFKPKYRRSYLVKTAEVIRAAIAKAFLNSKAGFDMLKSPHDNDMPKYVPCIATKDVMYKQDYESTYIDKYIRVIHEEAAKINSELNNRIIDMGDSISRQNFLAKVNSEQLTYVGNDDQIPNPKNQGLVDQVSKALKDAAKLAAHEDAKKVIKFVTNIDDLKVAHHQAYLLGLRDVFEEPVYDIYKAAYSLIYQDDGSVEKQVKDIFSTDELEKKIFSIHLYRSGSLDAKNN